MMFPSPRAPTAHTPFVEGTPVEVSFVDHQLTKEPTLPQPSSVVNKSLEHSSPQILSKSRTLNVLSGITASFSRSSFIPSRRTNNSSAASSVSAANTATSIKSCLSKPHSATRLPVTRGGWLSVASQESETPLSRESSYIYTEQPSAYWTGRFTSLYDKFQSECLITSNLQSLIDAQADRAVARNRQLQPHLLPPNRSPHHGVRLGHSATSAAILQQTSPSSDVKTQQGLDAKENAHAALLVDDDERCRRVFIHLEGFCANDEARKSLFTWQQDFARKTGRKKLLPRGGTMENRAWASYFSRMGVKKIGKRASIM